MVDISNWYRSGSCTDEKPDVIDVGKTFIRVRKDFVLIPEKGKDEHKIPAHWEWMEQKIRKEDWEFYQTLTDHTATLSDVEDALIELAEIITEG